MTEMLHPHPIHRCPRPRSLVLFALAGVLLSSCGSPGPSTPARGDDRPYVVVLGTAQDGGYPQAGCHKKCCARVSRDPSARRFTASLAIVDPRSHQRWVIDATPDFREQLRLLDSLSPPTHTPDLAGILLTHAHIGHYTGLMHLGREAIGADRVPVYAMPRMRQFLEQNGPWDQLVRLHNIEIVSMKDATPIRLGERIRVIPFVVPHRDEYSETVGFRIDGPARSVLYIPDIDKWERWGIPVESMLERVDLAYLDGTFFDAGELPGRNMAEIPHPFIVESLARFSALPANVRRRIHFIHFNHTNPVLDPAAPAGRAVTAKGMHLAMQGVRTPL